MSKVLIVEDDELIAKGMASHLAEARVRPSLGRKRRGRDHAPAVRAAGRLRPRPDAPAPRRLEGDRDGAQRGHRDADRRRQRTGQRAGPDPRARDRGRRLPREAVLDEGARRARARRRTPRRSGAGRSSRRADRARGAARRPAQRPGVRRREERRADAHRVPAPLRARARARTRAHAGRAAAEDLGPAAHAARPHGRRLRPQAAREDRPPHAEAQLRSHSLRRGLQARSTAKGGSRQDAPARSA